MYVMLCDIFANQGDEILTNLIHYRLPTELQMFYTLFARWSQFVRYGVPLLFAELVAIVIT
jgi:hypothetical protein